MRKAVCGVLVLASLPLAAGAWAQGNPSANSIIQSLTPRAGMTTGTRGIRPLAPSTEPAAPPAAPPPATAYAPSPSAAPAAVHVPMRRPAAPAPAAPQAATTQAAASAPAVNLTVEFATDSAQLTPHAEQTLNQLGQALSSQQLGSYKFRVEGHTDTVGAPDHNQSLSEARAKAVVEYLVSHFSIDRSRLEAVGMGEQHLLVQTRQNVPEPRNRRVTVINVGA